MGPYRVRHRSPEPSSTHSLVIYLFLKDPGNRASLHVPHRVPKDTCFIPRANGLLVHICQRSPPLKMGKTFVHRPRSRTWTEELHAVGCGLVSQPDCLHTAITAQCYAAFSTIPCMFTHCYHCPVPCSLQHDTFRVYTLLSLPSAMQPSARYLPC